MPIDWRPRSKKFHRHYRFGNRTFLNDDVMQNGNCTLTIKDMTPQDNGLFKCTLRSRSGREELLYYNITVYAPVERVTVVRSGDSLICSSERVCPKPRCRWSDASSNSTSTFLRDPQGLFSINCTAPLLHNVSQYRCTVSTAFSNKSASYIDRPPINLSGTEVTLPCGPSSAPVQSVTWTFDSGEGVVNQSSESRRWEASERWRPFVRNLSESGHLTLQKLTSDQQGLFTCVSTTDTETFTVNIRLEINGFSDLTTAALIVITLLLTVLTLALAYRRPQVPSVSQQPHQSVPQSSSSVEPPPDRFHTVKIICWMLGLVSVLPWHFLTMALLYFQHRVNISGQNWIFSLIVLVCQLPQLLSSVLSLFFVRRFSLRHHSTGCLVAITLLCVLVLVFMKVSTAREAFSGISLCALWLTSFFSAFVQHQLSEEVDFLPRSFALGQESAGIAASVILILCVAVFEDADASVFCYFVIACLASLAAVVGYCFLPHLSFAKHYFNQQRQMKEESSHALLNDKKNIEENQERLSSDSEATGLRMKIQKGCFVFLVYLVSFLVYPAVAADVHTTYPGVWDRFVIPVCCFFIFNSFNLIGQKIPFVSWTNRYFRFLFPILLVLYVGFIPLFMFCNVQPRTSLPLFNDYVFTVFMAAFSFFSGFFTHLTMFYEPNPEEEAGDDRTKIIGRAAGSVIGALLSFALRAGI